MDTSPSSGSGSFHTPRESFDMTPRFSNLSECIESDQGADVKHDNRNGAKTDNGESKKEKAPSKEESKAPYAEHSSKDKEISRRLVEYFVVVSSVPKIRKQKEGEKGSPKQNGESMQKQTSHQSLQTTARIDARRAHLDEEPRGGGNAGGSAATAGNSDDHNGQSTTDESRVSPPSPNPTISFPTISTAGESVFGESMSPYEKKSIASIQENDKMIGESIFSDEKKLGESMFSDEKSTTSSSTTQTMKKNFFRSMNEQKKKLQANTAKMQANTAKRNATGLQNLEKTLENLNIDKKVMTKLKSMKILTPLTSEVGKRGGGNQLKDDDDQSSDSGSSFSLDGTKPMKGHTSDASTFRPSQNATSARKTPVPLTPTPPPPKTISVPPLPGRPITPLRHLPLPDRHAVPRGASDNIRVGHESNTTFSNHNDDIDDCILEPVITAQYPPVDHPDQPLNPMLPQFCHPQGADVIVPLHEYKMPTVHHFVLTDSKGGKLYGTCLTVYEEFSPPSELEIRSGEEDDLDHSREEGHERGYVECCVNDSPKVGRSRRRAKDHKYYAPRVLCLLSTWPYLSAFRTYLTQLYRLATTTNLMTAPLERYIENICSEVPAPPPGSFEVKLEILNTTIRFWAPPADQPIPYVSLPYGVLFECLDIGNVLYVWYTLACERKILLVSSQLSLLAVCGEILCSMLFPMRWSHLYIPCLPRFLTPMLDAPMPYLCGISREIFPLAVADISDETVVVDLDRNVITMGKHTPEVPFLPHRRKLKLEATLEKHAGDVFWKARGLTTLEVEQARLSGDENELARMLGTADAVWDEKICAMDDAFKLSHGPDSMNILYSDGLDADRNQSRWDAVQEGFLRFYASMLKDYRKFMPSMPTNKQSSWRGGSVDDGRFLTDEFVQSQLPDFQPFLEELIGTQQFDDFVTRRMYNAGDAPDIKFFDQSIDAKRNRSKLKLKKKDTPFLHSAIAHRKLKQIDAIQPNRENLPPRSRFDSRFDFQKGQYTYPTWPESFDESLYGKPRPIPKIITAEFDRRSALTAVLRAKHGIVEGERLSGSNNPSPEATAFVLFFVTFSNTIGKEWTLLEKHHTMMGDNMLDDYPDGDSIESSVVSEGPWTPKVNPPWMDGDFQSLHSTFRPSKRPDPPEDIVHDNGPADELCAPDCTNFCVVKAIDPSTFLGTPWARNDTTPIESETPNMQYVRSPSEEEREDDIEKARAIAKAQIDMGFNTLKMMRMRKLPSEPITYKTLIEACGRCGIAHRAQQLMEMMTQDGMALDSEVYFAFIKAISNADSEAMPPYSRATDTSSEFSANMTTTRSTTSSSFSFLNPSQGEIEQSTKSSMRSNGTRFMDGFQNAMSSTIESNRRAFKTAKSKRLKRLFKQNLTKQKNLHVTSAIKTHLELGYCILADLYPGINIDTNSDTCPKCSCVLGQDNIISGWKPCQAKDFSTTCPSCKHTFVPKFSVSCSLESFEGSQGKGTPLYCDYLSPWVLLQEIRSLITTSVGGKAAKVLGVESNGIEQFGIDGIIDPKFREGSGINSTLWWNMIVTFARFKIPFTFLLQGSYKDQQLIMPTLEDT
eukprot:CAMPEP_0201946278 /NCGR_PEP_ID=MMETSP0903-20130614/54338_1 /ASSEMBLY_ACC=CAM_ASM_000552 /TAXON_ID=420261 /ORGANISM="Thalassiosira antarctica, Strain CCMP982" /LENGTH=1570 /DNA_ID=CAMNT_0048489375 /DNA_START=394 /DNA_END=5106 /DNA_ORIENTATION=-